MRKTIGSFQIAARLSDSCHAPMLVVASPSWQTTASVSGPPGPRYAIASAAPVAGGIWPPTIA